VYFFTLIYVCSPHLFLALILLALFDIAHNKKCVMLFDLAHKAWLFPKSTATTQNTPTKPYKDFALDLGTPVMQHFSEGKIKA